MPSDTPVWAVTAELLTRPQLNNHTHAAICIAGAGITGLTTAYLLAREGKSVVVLDDGPVGGGMTGRTSAHLCSAIDDRYFELERMHGGEGARLAAESHAAAIDRIEAIVQDEGINCDFERLDGYLFASPGDSTEVLERELEAAHRAGLTSVERVERAPIASFDTGVCLRFPRQGQFHPLKYLSGLARAIEQKGGRIYTGTHASKMEGGPPARVETRSGCIVTAEAIVMATNTPVDDRLTIHKKQAAYTTYVLAAGVPRTSVAGALYWDTADPYHYLRLLTLSRQGDHDLLIVGGEDHKTGQTDDGDLRVSRLEAWARERFPLMKKIEFRWLGQVMEPADGVAFIGRNPGDSKNVYIATGDSGMGLTHGTIAGILITDLIMGREPPWASLYNPSRKVLTRSRLSERRRGRLPGEG